MRGVDPAACVCHSWARRSRQYRPTRANVRSTALIQVGDLIHAVGDTAAFDHSVAPRSEYSRLYAHPSEWTWGNLK
jgi:hypothetical protein